jgi:hypothetical protein
MSRESTSTQAAPPEGPEPGARPQAVASEQEDSGKRSLTEAEIQKLKRVFSDGVDYARVRLKKLSSAIAIINRSRAFVLGNTVNLPSATYKDLLQGSKFSTLVHEMVHVWQYQHGGWGYVPDSLWAQTFGGGYDYVKPLRQGKAWRKMNPEQQAHMIADAHRSGYFDAPGALFGVANDKGAVIRPGERPPEGFTDYTAVIVAAVEELAKR